MKSRARGGPQPAAPGSACGRTNGSRGRRGGDPQAGAGRSPAASAPAGPASPISSPARSLRPAPFTAATAPRSRRGRP
jgi:hypothetical protein